MGINDRDWYRDELKKKQKQFNKRRPGGNSFDPYSQQENPLGVKSWLYLSITLNLILGCSLAYVLYR